MNLPTGTIGAAPRAWVCVYCGSRSGHGTRFAEQARAFGGVLVQRGLGLVYGGSRLGLMGAVADAVLAAGGRAIGVMPRTLIERERAHTQLTDLVVTDSMHARKAKMEALSDAFVALPGGIGTLDEFAEIWTWAQLGLHDKPFGLLNMDGYYDPLIAFFDRTVEAGFAAPAHRDRMIVGTHAEPLLDRLVPGVRSAVVPGYPG